MVAELDFKTVYTEAGCSLAKISMVAELTKSVATAGGRCSLAKISMVAEQLFRD